jgi:hypothetical protein
MLGCLRGCLRDIFWIIAFAIFIVLLFFGITYFIFIIFGILLIIGILSFFIPDKKGKEKK